MAIDTARRLRVLIVDDDNAALTSLEGVLSADHDVVACIFSADRARSGALGGQGRAARSTWSAPDFQMREMNGGELLRQIADLPGTARSCVLITGHAEVLTGEHRHAQHIFEHRGEASVGTSRCRSSGWWAGSGASPG